MPADGGQYDRIETGVAINRDMNGSENWEAGDRFGLGFTNANCVTRFVITEVRV
jgi:hypothetical protein